MSTINGIGTTFYGRARLEAGYITTKWIVIFYIPIIPLSSYVVYGESNDWWLFVSTTNYRLAKLPAIYRPHLRRFFQVWGAGIFLITLLALLL